MNTQTDTDARIHALLDGAMDAASCTPEERARLEKYQTALQRLAASRVQAPPELAARIVAALPEANRWRLRDWLVGFIPQRRDWLAPALAGAMATFVVLLGVWQWVLKPDAQRMRVHFQIHAPGAQRVELVGDFNHWTPGVIQLQGPDASGHWTADVDLPEGRYEYQFLVNGKTWVTDPDAPTHRSDGFGRENAVVEVYEDPGRS